MKHIFKNLVMGILGVIIYFYISIELMDTEAKNSYAGVILMSPFLFNRKKKDKTQINNDYDKKLATSWENSKKNYKKGKEKKLNKKNVSVSNYKGWVSNLKSNTEEKSKKIDVKSELKKYKEMLDEGLITQEQYDAKSNKLLGL